MALAGRPAHEAVLGAQVEDVELVDPGRDDQQRPPQHRLGGRRVLDQMHQGVLVHHLAGRQGDVLADAERFGVGHLDAQVAAAALEIGEQVVQALDQVLAAGLGSLAQHLGIGQQEVARAHRVDELAGIEIDFLRGRRLQPVHMRHHVLHEAGGQQVGLLDEVEDVVRLPGFVLEAAVLRVGLDDRRGFHAHHPARGVLPQRHVVLPETKLRLHQMCRVGHQLGGHLQEGVADVQRVRAAGALGGLAL